MNLFFTLAPTMTATKAPYVTVNEDSIHINDNNVTLTLSWEEPFNNLDPIVNYIVSCSGDVTCPPNFTTAVRSYIITNLTPMTNYTFSVIATNSIGSGEAGVVMITTPPGKLIRYYIPMFLFCKHICDQIWENRLFGTTNEMYFVTPYHRYTCVLKKSIATSPPGFIIVEQTLKASTDSVEPLRGYNT